MSHQFIGFPETHSHTSKSSDHHEWQEPHMTRTVEPRDSRGN